MSVPSTSFHYAPFGSVDKNPEATLYVANLDERVTDDLLWELFTQVGPVVHVYIPKDRVVHIQAGYGFIEFQNESDAEYAIQTMSGIKLYGKPLKVNKASQNRQVFDIGANLYISNLDASIDERYLQDTFGVFGRVLQAKIGRDNDTGVPRGFAFVNFDSFEAADAAIESMSGQFLANRPISISYAFKKDGKPGERHGTAAERFLAEQARKNAVHTGPITTSPSTSGQSSIAASMQAYLESAALYNQQQQQQQQQHYMYYNQEYLGLGSYAPMYPFPPQNMQ